MLLRVLRGEPLTLLLGMPPYPRCSALLVRSGGGVVHDRPGALPGGLLVAALPFLDVLRESLSLKGLGAQGSLGRSAKLKSGKHLVTRIPAIGAPLERWIADLLQHFETTQALGAGLAISDVFVKRHLSPVGYIATGMC